MVSALAPNQLHAITSACRRHRVARLHVFGSVLRPDDRPGASDIDLLVEFQPDAPEALTKPISAFSTSSGGPLRLASIW